MAIDDYQNIFKKPIKDIILPVFSSKQKQESALDNKNILSDFYGNLGEAMESQKGSPLYYGSKFCDIIGITKLFSHHEDKDRIVNKIQKCSR